MRAIDTNNMKAMYSRSGISSYKTSQVSDAQLNEYVNNLFEAAKVLNEMLMEADNQVFLHCTTGISRSPTLVIVYLALFLRHKYWDSPKDLEEFVKKAYPDA